MAYKILLIQKSNQQMSFQFDDQRYVITLNCLNVDSSGTGLMAASIDLNETRILTGSLIQPLEWIIPFPYLEGDGGNLIFTATGDKNIWYEEFNITQSLYYLTKDEVAAVRAS